MAIRHLYTLLCNQVVEAKDGTVSAIGIFHNIMVPGFPAQKEQLGLIVAFRGEPGDPFSVSWEGPGGFHAVLGEGTVEEPANLRENQQWATTAVGMARNVTFPEAGVYRIVLRSGDTEISSYRFGVFPGRVEESAEEDA